jgi:hypothetical protein
MVRDGAMRLLTMRGCDKTADTTSRSHDQCSRFKIKQPRYSFAFSRRECARALYEIFVPPITEGAGNAGCPMHPQPCVRMKKAHKQSHHRYADAIRHPLREGFTAYFVLSPVTGLFCHRRLQATACKLDTSVGASGPHDFAVRGNLHQGHSTDLVPVRRSFSEGGWLRSSLKPPRPSHPALNVRDDREAPLLSSAGRPKQVAVICPTGQAEYFFGAGWTGIRQTTRRANQFSTCFCLSMLFLENRCPLRIDCGAGFFPYPALCGVDR